jgi:hypothetical protein
MFRAKVSTYQYTPHLSCINLTKTNKSRVANNSMPDSNTQAEDQFLLHMHLTAEHQAHQRYSQAIIEYSKAKSCKPNKLIDKKFITKCMEELTQAELNVILMDPQVNLELKNVLIALTINQHSSTRYQYNQHIELGKLEKHPNKVYLEEILEYWAALMYSDGAADAMKLFIQSALYLSADDLNLILNNPQTDITLKSILRPGYEMDNENATIDLDIQPKSIILSLLTQNVTKTSDNREKIDINQDLFSIKNIVISSDMSEQVYSLRKTSDEEKKLILLYNANELKKDIDDNLLQHNFVQAKINYYKIIALYKQANLDINGHETTSILTSINTYQQKYHTQKNNDKKEIPLILLQQIQEKFPLTFQTQKFLTAQIANLIEQYWSKLYNKNTINLYKKLVECIIKMIVAENFVLLSCFHNYYINNKERCILKLNKCFMEFLPTQELAFVTMLNTGTTNTLRDTAYFNHTKRLHLEI